MRKIGPLNYELELPDAMKVHPVFHVELLTKHETDTIPGRRQKPPDPVLVDEEEEYEVQEVRQSRRNRGKLQYLVHWRGYTDEYDSWVDESDMEHAKALVRAFYRRYPTAMR